MNATGTATRAVAAERTRGRLLDAAVARVAADGPEAPPLLSRVIALLEDLLP